MVSKAERILGQIQERVGGELRISRRGVPHLVIGGIGGLSVAYFCRTRKVRVFTNYMQPGTHPKFDFTEWAPAREFIRQQVSA